MAPAERVQIPGSEREFTAEHERVRDVDADKLIDVTVYLRPKGTLDWVDDEARRLPADRRSITREELAQGYAAREGDIEAVSAFARDHGLEVTSTNAARRTVTLRGTVEAVGRAFGAEYAGVYNHPEEGLYRARRGPLTVPADLGDVVTGVFGIDERPQAKPHLRWRHKPRAPQPVSYTPQQVAQAYNFPSSGNGDGETVGIIELGGGFSEADLDAYFNGSPPTVIAVGVDGGKNSPGTDQGADGEVMLDVEVVGAVAPGATIVVYFAPNTDQGFIDAVSTAVHDTTHHPSAVSISWGGPEDSWTQQARTQMEHVMIEAAAVGVTVTAAAGDNGSTDGVSDGKQHVDFPASAPHVLACGGTTLQVSNGQITSETVWNELTTNHGATGGGVSVEFPTPSYQSTINPTNVDTRQTGRGVPDVSGDADPETGYEVLVDGQRQVIGGTSAVAPLWAGLTALLNEALGKPVGFLQPLIYAGSARGGFNDITQGNNPAYEAGAGWDACTGLGSPNGTALLEALGGKVAASAQS